MQIMYYTIRAIFFIIAGLQLFGTLWFYTYNSNIYNLITFLLIIILFLIAFINLESINKYLYLAIIVTGLGLSTYILYDSITRVNPFIIEAITVFGFVILLILMSIKSYK